MWSWRVHMSQPSNVLFQWLLSWHTIHRRLMQNIRWQSFFLGRTHIVHVYVVAYTRPVYQVCIYVCVCECWHFRRKLSTAFKCTVMTCILGSVLWSLLWFHWHCPFPWFLWILDFVDSDKASSPRLCGLLPVFCFKTLPSSFILLLQGNKTYFVKTTFGFQKAISMEYNYNIL